LISFLLLLRARNTKKNLPYAVSRVAPVELGIHWLLIQKIQHALTKINQNIQLTFRFVLKFF
ncbi:hypothetical protein, partial [Gardnerella vaginalis]